MYLEKLCVGVVACGSQVLADVESCSVQSCVILANIVFDRLVHAILMNLVWKLWPLSKKHRHGLLILARQARYCCRIVLQQQMALALLVSRQLRFTAACLRSACFIKNCNAGEAAVTLRRRRSVQQRRPCVLSVILTSPRAGSRAVYVLTVLYELSVANALALRSTDHELDTAAHLHSFARA